MIRDVYDIEKAVEAAVTKLFEDRMTALSSQDAPEFQKPRGRVEVVCQKGAGTGHLAMTELTGLECEVEDSWQMSIQLWLLTAADMQAHGESRAFVRYTAARLAPLVNGTLLTRHEIYGPMVSAGDSPTLKPEQGIFETALNYKTLVSIRPEAWALLKEDA
jgi:hypothetical protein